MGASKDGRERSSAEISGSGRIEWMYPNIYEDRDRLVVALMHTRAADNLIIEFDSAENAWLVKMERTIEHEGYMEPTGEYDAVKIPAWNTVDAPDPNSDRQEGRCDEPICARPKGHDGPHQANMVGWGDDGEEGETLDAVSDAKLAGLLGLVAEEMEKKGINGVAVREAADRLRRDEGRVREAAELAYERLSRGLAEVRQALHDALNADRSEEADDG